MTVRTAPASPATRRKPNRPAPRPPLLRVVVVALAGFLIGLAVALTVASSGRSTPGASSSPPAPIGPDSAAGPRGVEEGVPVGYARTPAGAAAAATAYLTVSAEGLLLMDAPARDAALRRMLVPDPSPGTLAQVVGDPTLLERVRQASAGSGTPRAVLRNLPVAYRVDAFSPARARVSVWGAAVWSIAGVGGPGEAWTTTSLELEWVEGDWRLWSLSSKEGPTPATTSGPVAGTDELIAALGGFLGYRYGPA